MKYCTFIKDGEERVGIQVPGGAADVTELVGSLGEVIRGVTTLDAVPEDAPVIPESELVFGSVTKPGKLLCVGLNYRSHAEETGGEAPKEPMFFSKFGDCLCPSGHPVKLPGWQRCFDYEAELVIVMGKTAYHVSPEEAMDCVFGYTCGNDLSARDCQFITSQWLSGKSFPDFAPAGPWIVTADCFDPDAANGIFCSVNGQRVQTGDTSDMLFPCREIISRASRYFRLEAGDLIFTGTPAGVILGRPKGTRVWLKPGDTVSVTIEGIGTLTNPLI